MTRVEAFEISNRAVSRFEKTRELQWKVNITAWTLIVAGIYFFNQKDFKINIGFVWVLALAFLTLHCIYILFIQSSLNRSWTVEKNIYEKLNKEDKASTIDVNLEKIKSSARFNTPDYLWIFFQVSISIILLSVFVAVNLSK